MLIFQVDMGTQKSPEAPSPEDIASLAEQVEDKLGPEDLARINGIIGRTPLRNVIKTGRQLVETLQRVVLFPIERLAVEQILKGVKGQVKEVLN